MFNIYLFWFLDFSRKLYNNERSYKNLFGSLKVIYDWSFHFELYVFFVWVVIHLKKLTVQHFNVFVCEMRNSSKYSAAMTSKTDCFSDIYCIPTIK